MSIVKYNIFQTFFQKSPLQNTQYMLYYKYRNPHYTYKVKEYIYDYEKRKCHNRKKLRLPQY